MRYGRVAWRTLTAVPTVTAFFHRGYRGVGGLRGAHDLVELERVEEIVDLLNLTDIRGSLAGSLPLGLKKRVELGRALAANPKILLRDEPMGGMNIEEKEDMCR